MASSPEALEPWFAFCQRLRLVALDMLRHSVQIQGPSLDAPATFAAALLSRSLQHLQGLELVARAGLLVEAASLARACVENALWMRKLDNDPAFAAAIRADDHHHDASFAKRILRSPLNLGFDDDQEKFLAEVTARKGQAIAISETEDQDAERDYMSYRFLSANFAHPSFSSLRRHLSSDERTVEVIVEPKVTPNAIESILPYALVPLIGMVDHYGKIALGQTDDARVADLEVALMQVIAARCGPGPVP